MGDWSNKLAITFGHISPRKIEISYFEIANLRKKIVCRCSWKDVTCFLLTDMDIRSNEVGYGNLQ